MSPEVLPAQRVVTWVALALSRPELASPSRGEGRRALLRHLPERLFNQRGKRHAAGPGVPSGHCEQFGVHRDRELVFHSGFTSLVLSVARPGVRIRDTHSGNPPTGNRSRSMARADGKARSQGNLTGIILKSIRRVERTRAPATGGSMARSRGGAGRMPPLGAATGLRRARSGHLQLVHVVDELLHTSGQACAAKPKRPWDGVATVAAACARTSARPHCGAERRCGGAHWPRVRTFAQAAQIAKASSSGLAPRARGRRGKCANS